MAINLKQNAVLLPFFHHFKHNRLPFCLSCQHITQFVLLVEDCNSRTKFSEIKVVWMDENTIVLKIYCDYLSIRPRIIYELE